MIKDLYKLSAVLLFFAGTFRASAQINLGFEQGLMGWKRIGQPTNFTIATSDAHEGRDCLRIGEGFGAIQTLVVVGQLSIIQYKCYLRSERKGIKAFSFVKFYNREGKLLLEYKSKGADSTGWQEIGNYTETPAGTAYAEIGVEKDKNNSGYIYADDFSIQTNIGAPKRAHKPLCNLDAYMKPFWLSDTIYNETVLMFSTGGKPAGGKLLFMPDRILSIRSFDLKDTYAPGKDYSVTGDVITRTLCSKMPFRADTSFDIKKDLAWFNTQSQWVVVTYTHHDKWDGPTSVYKGQWLPRTMARLMAKRPLCIAAYGMSITRGMDVSSYDTVPPYMSTYVDLFARQLAKKYHDPKIKLYNAGLPGSVVDWAAQYAEKYINPLKPNLVIIDFGMNDFWRLTPEQFEGYIKTIIKKIKSANPKVEFILLSDMRFDPDYVLPSDKYKSWYEANLKGYSEVLKRMEAPGIINLDMYAISDAIYRRKKAKDCLVNPLHPNDYLARWYAQGLTALLSSK